MVCLRYIIVNTLHKGDTKDDDDDNNNNNNNMLLLLLLLPCRRPFLQVTSLEPMVIPTTQASSFRLLYFSYYI